MAAIPKVVQKSNMPSQRGIPLHIIFFITLPTKWSCAHLWLVPNYFFSWLHKTLWPLLVHILKREAHFEEEDTLSYL